MKFKRQVLFNVLVCGLLVVASGTLNAGNVIIETFNDYESTEELLGVWQKSGDISKSIELGSDTVLIAPGVTYLKYTYNGVGNGIVEHVLSDTTFFPLNVTGAKSGLQFLLKGDGTSNYIRLRCYQLFDDSTEAVWGSHPISLTDTTWHIVRIPFELDNADTNGLHLISTTGSVAGTEIDLENCLAHIRRFQVYLESATTGDQSIYLDEFRAVDFFPPRASIQICLDDFESYPNTDIFKQTWGAFGYPVRDKGLRQDENSPEGYRNAYVLYNFDETTTWGMCFRKKWVDSLDISSTKDGGIQFLMKGDGVNKGFRLYLAEGDHKRCWASYVIPLQDTTWHLVTVPFVVDSNEGFRWCGDDWTNTYFTPNIGTIDELIVSLSKVREIRFMIKKPFEIDGIPRSLELDAIYAVSDLPPNVPISVDDFEYYTDTDDLKLSWNQFGTGSSGLELTTETAASGVQAMKVTYNGLNGYTAVRKRNIIPAHDFSEQGEGIQFWLKGDGSSNSITFRLQKGNEMWESYKIPLSNTEWVHWAIDFKADSVKGFRYLGNNPDNPIWSANIGTDSQLYGDLSAIDQVRFYVRNPQAVDYTYSFLIDNIEGVDEYDENIVYSSSGITDSEHVNPNKYSLKQNYPNPFNPTTTLEYKLEEPGIVKLSVYNLLGQNVNTLVNTYQGNGAYKVVFDASRFASGIYFYRLEIKNTSGKRVYSQIKKMVLLK